MDTKGFFGALFDLSFNSMITVRIVQLLYVLSLVMIGLIVLAIFIAAADDSSASAVIVLILSPFIFIITAIFARVYLETLIVLFKIAENTGDTAAAVKIRSSATSSAEQSS